MPGFRPGSPGSGQALTLDSTREQAPSWWCPPAVLRPPVRAGVASHGSATRPNSCDRPRHAPPEVGGCGLHTASLTRAGLGRRAVAAVKPDSGFFFFSGRVGQQGGARARAGGGDMLRPRLRGHSSPGFLWLHKAGERSPTATTFGLLPRAGGGPRPSSDQAGRDGRGTSSLVLAGNIPARPGREEDR